MSDEQTVDSGEVSLRAALRAAFFLGKLVSESIFDNWCRSRFVARRR